MDRLPAELINIISSYLEPPLAGYAAISPRWQQAIEPRIFWEIKTDSDDASLRQFQAAFSTPRRRALLRWLSFRVQLPSPSLKRMRKLQSRREAAANSLVYTRALAALFSFLHTWEHHGNVWIGLDLTVSSPMDNYAGGDHGHMGDPIWTIRNKFRDLHFDADALREAGGLATVPVVSRFTIDSNSNRRIAPAVMPLLAKALPNVRQMTWSFLALPRRMPDLRRVERMSLAKGLFSIAALNLPLLTSLSIYWDETDPFNEAFNLGSLVDPASGRDDVSIALRRISQLPSLQRLSLLGCHTVSAQLFEDDHDDASTSNCGASTWPSLTHLALEMSVTTPDGRWYFTGDESNAEYAEEDVYDSDELDESPAAFDSADSDTSDYAPADNWAKEEGMSGCFFRTAPDPVILVPFLISMVRAVIRMPVLRRLEVSMSNLSGGPRLFADYFGPGEPGNLAMAPSEQAFYDAHLCDPRWVLHLYGEWDAAWSIPPEWRAALRETSAEGCVYIGKVRGYEQF